MDKETLSNYGWIVICVLVLVVMIALATPFGSFVSEAVQSTTKGLFDVNKTALDAAGVPGLTVQDQEFDVPDMNHKAVYYGDLDMDGDVDEDDKTLIARHVGKISTLKTDEQLKRADVDGDGDIDASDMALVAQYVEGMIDTFPAEQ